MSVGIGDGTVGMVGQHKLPNLWRVARAQALPLSALAAVLGVTWLGSPQFFGWANLFNIARQASIVAVIAVGMTFVILTGGIDLSVGAILAIGGVVTAMALNAGVSAPMAVILAMGLGIVIGIANGIGVTILHIPPFIATLAMLVLIRGVALRITDGTPVGFSVDDAFFDFFGGGRIGPLPGPFLLFVLMAAVGWCVLRYTPFGRYVYAIGGSEEAARLVGIHIDRVLVGVYALSGLSAALAGVMSASRLSIGNPIAGNLVELDAITAVVVGGTSLLGGVGGMAGTVFGALFLAVLANAMNLLGVSPFDQMIVRGLVIAIAVVLAVRSTRRHAGTRTQVGEEMEEVTENVPEQKNEGVPG